MPDLEDKQIFPGGIAVKALFQPEYRWKLVEEYGPYCYAEQEDGRLLFQTNFTNRDYLMDWLFSFRDGVELIEPKDIREEIGRVIENMRAMYRD